MAAVKHYRFERIQLVEQEIKAKADQNKAAFNAMKNGIAVINKNIKEIDRITKLVDVAPKKIVKKTEIDFVDQKKEASDLTKVEKKIEYFNRSTDMIKNNLEKFIYELEDNIEKGEKLLGIIDKRRQVHVNALPSSTTSRTVVKGTVKE